MWFCDLRPGVESWDRRHYCLRPTRSWCRLRSSSAHREEEKDREWARLLGMREPGRAAGRSLHPKLMPRSAHHGLIAVSAWWRELVRIGADFASFNDIIRRVARPGICMFSPIVVETTTAPAENANCPRRSDADSRAYRRRRDALTSVGRRNAPSSSSAWCFPAPVRPMMPAARFPADTRRPRPACRPGGLPVLRKTSRKAMIP